MTALPVDPNQARVAWVEAERIRRREVLVQMDGPHAQAARIRDLIAADAAHNRTLAWRRAEGRAS